jgi:hypothetical protein
MKSAGDCHAFTPGVSTYIYRATIAMSLPSRAKVVGLHLKGSPVLLKAVSESQIVELGLTLRRRGNKSAELQPGVFQSSKSLQIHVIIEIINTRELVDLRSGSTCVP